MKPMDAWKIISKCFTELAILRTDKGLKSHCAKEIEAEVICFRALKEMEERSNENAE